jgi:hypothetical protein
MRHTLQVRLQNVDTFFEQLIAVQLVGNLLLLLRVLFIEVLVQVAVDPFDIAIERVVVLTQRFIQNAKIQPGRVVLVVELYGAYVGLQGVHRLILLLIKNTCVMTKLRLNMNRMIRASTHSHTYRTPGVRVRFATVSYVAVGVKSVRHVAFDCVHTSQVVPGQALGRVVFRALDQQFDGLFVVGRWRRALGLIRVEVEPTQLPEYFSAKLIAEVVALQKIFVFATGLDSLVLNTATFEFPLDKYRKQSANLH